MKNRRGSAFLFTFLLLAAGCPANNTVPHSTTADATLRRDVTRAILDLDASLDRACTDRKIASTARPDLAVPIESWIVDRCSTFVDYRVTYSPAPQGGTTFAITPVPFNAPQGDVVELAAAAAAYERGDNPTALAIWQRLANEGVSEAQYNVGFIHLFGVGVPKDPAEGERWYRAAAEQGFVQAQYELGAFYLFGRNLPQKIAEGIKWTRAAAQQAHSRAQNNLGASYEKGRGVPQDYAEALEWYRKAAEQGHALAQNSVGALYAKGQGVSRDFVEAYAWFELAISGLEPGKWRDIATRNKKAAASVMTPAQIAKAENLVRQWRQAHPNLPRLDYMATD